MCMVQSCSATMMKGHVYCQPLPIVSPYLTQASIDTFCRSGFESSPILLCETTAMNILKIRFLLPHPLLHDKHKAVLPMIGNKAIIL